MKIKTAILEILHQLMVTVETYMVHNSFTSLQGGFRVKLNGVTIFKV